MKKKEPVVHALETTSAGSLPLPNLCDGKTVGCSTGIGICECDKRHTRVTCPKCKAKMRKAKR